MNDTDNKAVDTVLAGSFILVAIPGLVLNSLVLVISCRKGLVDGEYKWFLGNCALIDILLCLVSGIGQPY